MPNSQLFYDLQKLPGFQGSSGQLGIKLMPSNQKTRSGLSIAEQYCS